jgi:hypothetical protein
MAQTAPASPAAPAATKDTAKDSAKKAPASPAKEAPKEAPKEVPKAAPAAPAASDGKEKAVTFEYGPMGMMTENKTGKITITNVLIGGQADKGTVKINDFISGINGVACIDCMADPGDTEELKKMMAVAVRPIIVNFNKKFDSAKNNTKKPAPKPSVPEKPKLDPGMEQFKSLMIQGLEVIKHHSKGKKKDKRILYMDPKMENVYCGAKKGDPKTKKVYSIHDDITHVRPVDKSTTQLEIATSKKVKGKAETLKVEVPTPKARDLIVDKLAVLIRHEKAAKKHEEVHGPK